VSGWNQTPRKRPCLNGHRGFESLSLRQIIVSRGPVWSSRCWSYSSSITSQPSCTAQSIQSATFNLQFSTTLGRKAEAEEILRQLQRQSKTSYVSPYIIAAIYAGLADKNRAFEYLEKAYQERSSDVLYFLKADLRIDSLRDDPRFQDLLRRMNFPR